MAFNKVILIGNMVEDAELRTTPSGVAVASFRIAVGRRFKQEGQPEADFVTIVTWRSSAEFASKYFRKGDTVLVCGQLQQRGYTDKDGVKRTTYEVVADEVSFAGYKKPSEGESVSSGEAKAEKPTASAVNGPFEELGSEDDLPF